MLRHELAHPLLADLQEGLTDRGSVRKKSAAATGQDRPRPSLHPQTRGSEGVRLMGSARRLTRATFRFNV